MSMKFFLDECTVRVVDKFQPSSNWNEFQITRDELGA